MGQVGRNDLADCRVIQINDTLQLFPMTSFTTSILENSLTFLQGMLIIWKG
jgi:hypothetical protein